jgi:hypothetical protein
MQTTTRRFAFAGAALLAAGIVLGPSAGAVRAQTRDRGYSSATAWKLRAENLRPHGTSPYHVPLVPGAHFVLEDEVRDSRREVRVLDQTEPFHIPSFGGKFETAVLEEKEFVGGDHVTTTHRYCAIDTTTGRIYAFGETTWRGERIAASWRAGTPDDFGIAEPGLVAPDRFVVGAKYVVRGSEGSALSGAEVVAQGVAIETPAGKFEDCARVREVDLVEGTEIEKCWCRGVGLVSDASAGVLTEIGTPESGAPVQAVPAAAAGGGRKITDEQAADIARAAVPGQVMDIAIERKMGGKRIVVEVIAAEDMAETDVIIDMETGEVLGIEK